MREKKWTAGPWRVEGGWGVVHSGGGTMKVADCRDAHRGRDEYPWHEIPEDEIEANARLIAAAPEMAEALEALYQAHCDAKFTLADEDYFLITAAAGALAKAYGES